MQNTAEYPETTLICSENTMKNSHFVVFEIANNFIVEMPFLPYRLATKKLVYSQSTVEQPIFASQY